MKPEMNVIKMQHSCQLMAGSPLSLDGTPGFIDGYSNHDPATDDIDL